MVAQEAMINFADLVSVDMDDEDTLTTEASSLCKDDIEDEREAGASKVHISTRAKKDVKNPTREEPQGRSRSRRGRNRGMKSRSMSPKPSSSVSRLERRRALTRNLSRSLSPENKHSAGKSDNTSQLEAFLEGGEDPGAARAARQFSLMTVGEDHHELNLEVVAAVAKRSTQCRGTSYRLEARRSRCHSPRKVLDSTMPNSNLSKNQDPTLKIDLPSMRHSTLESSEHDTGDHVGASVTQRREQRKAKRQEKQKMQKTPRSASAPSLLNLVAKS